MILKINAGKVLLFLSILLTAVGIIFFMGSGREAQFLKDGAAHGFEIDGTYRDQETHLISASFHTEEGKRWQLVNKKDVINGTFEGMGDPNIFILHDESGTEYGFAHLAFSSPDGEQGLLYLKIGSTVATFDKMNRGPAFVDTEHQE